jgi:uridine kinase
VGIDVVDRIAAAVLAREPVSGIRIVGVDGPSGSGKSHLAGRLAGALSAPIVEIDDFVSWESFAGWWPRFDAQVLAPLLAGKDAVYQVRDWSDWHGSSLGEWKTLPWSPTVIFEGVTCTRRDTIGWIGYAVWVEAPEDLRLARGLARDSAFADAEDLWKRWMSEEELFFRSDGTRERADIIIDTSEHGLPR